MMIFRKAGFITLICLAVAVTACTQARKADEQVTTVDSVSLERYAGKWYEIARFPHSFEKNCVGVTAEYAIISSERLSVSNTCYKKRFNGSVDVAKGKADVVKGSGGAKLKVVFEEFPANLFAGDYWINMLDKDYNWVVVTDSTGSYLWIMARNPHIDDELYNNIVAGLKKRGFKTEYLSKTPQR